MVKKYSVPTLSPNEMLQQVNAARQAQVQDPDDVVYQSLVRGFSVKEVAFNTGKSIEEVDQVCRRLLEDSRSRISSGIGMATILEIERMDLALKVLLPLVEQGDLGAIDRMIAIGKQRRALMGLDAAEIKLALNLSADAQNMDLSGLDRADLEALERIQAKIQQKSVERLNPVQKRLKPPPT